MGARRRRKRPEHHAARSTHLRRGDFAAWAGEWPKGVSAIRSRPSTNPRGKSAKALRVAPRRPPAVSPRLLDVPASRGAAPGGSDAPPRNAGWVDLTA